ncbi:hypothetical protein ACRU43_13455 [Mycobacterium colombiense]
MFGNLERLPGAPQLHRWADWGELLAYTAAAGSLSISELSETTERREDYIDAESEDEQDPRETEHEPLIDAAREEPAQFRDELAKRAGDIFRYLAGRSMRYGAAYPFEIDQDEQLIIVRELTDQRRLYLFLLTCASLRYITNRPQINALTAKFELLALNAVRQMLPLGSEVHLFGANPIAATRYTGLLFGKLKLLADDLGEILLVTEDEFERGNTGDNGLDVVGWVPLGDSSAGRITVFGQAACTPEWVSKQHSAHASSWSLTMTLTADPINMIFIPYDYRKPSGEWYNKRHIHKSVVIDRYRMMRSLTKLENADSSLLIVPEDLELIELAAVDIAGKQEAADL